MRCQSFSLLAAATLAIAAPQQHDGPKLSGGDIVNVAQSALDHDGKLEWKEVGGGRIAHLPSSALVGQAQKRDDPNTFADKSWKHGSQSTVDGRGVWHMCFSTGSMLQSNDLAAYADVVCPTLVKAVVDHVPGGSFVQDGWQIYQMISDVKAADGSGLVSGALNWALGNADPERNEEMSDVVCEELFKAMENTECYADGWTKGIASWARGWVILGDPEMQNGDP
ncbi:hypothetical protein UCREL1_10397 [Eutypa lata UCREL1]|uniref:Ecp2 effector protein domain-containing protein n=1 Tax=Eutypa lata (strain UCR-EL1) TaxID=1287681 RepID=M7SYL8_EUTLA|nr:hypothetical protein UCREL1_10397 [Eutypa lata UCREL1]